MLLQLGAVQVLGDGLVRVVKKGQPIPVDRLAAHSEDANHAAGDLELVHQEFRAGATLVFPFLHNRWPSLRGLVRNLSEELSAGVQINAYLTPPGARGFQTHYDTHDVLVLQVHGSKRWRVFEPPVTLPLADDAFQATGHEDEAPLVDEFILAQGDSFYLPRGFLHDATSTDSTSLHLTVGIRPITWAAVVVGAVEAVIATRPDLRAALPPGFARTAQGRDRAQLRLADLLQVAVAAADPVAAIAGAATEALLSQPPELSGHLLDLEGLESLTPTSLVFRRPLAQWLLDDSVDGDEVCLEFHGKRLTLPAHSRSAVEAIVRASGAFTPQSLPGNLDEESRVVLTRRLVQEGFLTLAV